MRPLLLAAIYPIVVYAGDLQVRTQSPVMRLTQNNGFGLITVVIGIAVVGVLAMIIAGISSSMFKYSANVNAVSNARGIMNILTGVISYPTLCKGSLQASTSTYNDAQAATDDGMPLAFAASGGAGGGSGGSNLYADGRDFPYYGIRIQTLRFKKIGAPVPDPAISGNQLYSGTLSIQMNKIGDPGSYLGGNTMKEKVISNMVLSVDPSTNNIANCYAISGARQACIDMGGAYDPVDTPHCKLPYPCGNGTGKVFMGYDSSSGAPNCFTAAELIGQVCPANTYLVSDGDGKATCKPL